jgi:hypothetical protein
MRGRGIVKRAKPQPHIGLDSGRHHSPLAERDMTPVMSEWDDV